MRNSSSIEMLAKLVIDLLVLCEVFVFMNDRSFQQKTRYVLFSSKTVWDYYQKGFPTAPLTTEAHKLSCYFPPTVHLIRDSLVSGRFISYDLIENLWLHVHHAPGATNSRRRSLFDFQQLHYTFGFQHRHAIINLSNRNSTCEGTKSRTNINEPLSNAHFSSCSVFSWSHSSTANRCARRNNM